MRITKHLIVFRVVCLIYDEIIILLIILLADIYILHKILKCI